MNPSVHLSWDELACKDGAPYPERWRCDRALDLACAFEAIRALWGKPIAVTSAFRTREYNRLIGGAARSQHCEGRALDLKPPAGITTRHFYQVIVMLAEERPDIGIRYIQGYRRGWVHVDIRPRQRLSYEWAS